MLLMKNYELTHYSNQSTGIILLLNNNQTLLMKNSNIGVTYNCILLLSILYIIKR